jgi:hypothetical protein
MLSSCIVYVKNFASKFVLTNDTKVAACRGCERTSEGWSKRNYRVDVDIPADEWINITKFYDVLIFNTGHS